jgi:predicted PurR-regulated permease PerM
VGIALTTLLVALQDFSMGMRVLIAAVIVQQILENLIAPRILGNFTGLNPVWILISVLTGARIGGLLGVIVAVPTAVVIKTALSALRPRNETNDSTTGEITASVAANDSSKANANKTLSISEATLP